MNLKCTTKQRTCQGSRISVQRRTVPSQEQKVPRGGAVFTLFRALFSADLLVDGLKRVELEVILLIEPAALEDLQRERSSSRQSERVNRELDMRMRFFSCFRLVIEDVDVTVANLEEINMPRDDVALEI